MQKVSKVRAVVVLMCITHKGFNRLIVATAMNRDDGGCGSKVVVAAMVIGCHGEGRAARRESDFAKKYSSAVLHSVFPESNFAKKYSSAVLHSVFHTHQKYRSSKWDVAKVP